MYVQERLKEIFRNSFEKLYLFFAFARVKIFLEIKRWFQRGMAVVCKNVNDGVAARESIRA